MPANITNLQWSSLIQQYIETGDISKLEAKIRQDGVPASCGNRIADLLTGSLKPLTPQKQAGVAFKRKAEVLIFEQLKSKVNVLFMSYNDGKKYKISLTNQKIAEFLYPLYIKDDARSAFNRLRRKYNMRK